MLDITSQFRAVFRHDVLPSRDDSSSAGVPDGFKPFEANKRISCLDWGSKRLDLSLSVLSPRDTMKIFKPVVREMMVTDHSFRPNCGAKRSDLARSN